MKILVVGLGLMGGAYCYKLKNKNHYIYGSDINPKSIEYALQEGFIDEGNTDPTEFIKSADLIILSFYPQAILSFIDKYHDLFNSKQIITDICGVKSSFVREATNKSKPALYLSHHPMAGREKIGIEYSKECVFDGANFLITPIEYELDNKTYYINEEAIPTLKEIGKDLGFNRITVININKHDRMIGFTSQLTHAIAVSLVNSDRDIDTKNFIGDSYRDLTRIAKINENLWSELFLENKDYLLKHIEEFEIELDKLKNALNNNDREALKELFKSSTKIRKEMDK